MSSCKISIDNYAEPYYAGSPIYGRVICNFHTEKIIRAIKVRLICEEATEWMERKSQRDRRSKVHRVRYERFNGTNNVIFQEIVLHSGDNIPEGNHVFIFCFNLPKKCPTTFESTYGFVKYKIKAIVDRPVKDDYTDEIFFSVVSLIDCNEMSSNITQPSSCSEEKNVCCLCCTSGPISLKLMLAKRCYVPGEIMNVKLNIINYSNVDVQWVKFSFNQDLEYLATEPYSKNKSDPDNLWSLEQSGVSARDEKIYNLEVEIPKHLIVFNFQSCTLFAVYYTFVVTCGLPSCHSNIELKAYPEIGHIKLNEEGDKTTVKHLEHYPLPIINNYPPNVFKNGDHSIGFKLTGSHHSKESSPSTISDEETSTIKAEDNMSYQNESDPQSCRSSLIIP